MQNSEADSTVEVLDVHEIRARPRAVKMPDPLPPSPTPPPEAPVIQRVGIPEAMVSVFSALAFALSARLLLLLALLGAFTLAFLAMRSQTPISVGILVSYCLLVIAPLIYLETQRRG